jgi:hypothetical protein
MKLHSHRQSKINNKTFNGQTLRKHDNETIVMVHLRL